MERLRLRAIIPVSFTKSEETNFDEIYRQKKYRPLIDSLDHNDCICLIALGGNQLYFMRGYAEMHGEGKKWIILASRKYRIKRGPGLADAFEPLMLANYARAVGIELVGLKLFEEYFKDLT